MARGPLEPSPISAISWGNTSTERGRARRGGRGGGLAVRVNCRFTVVMHAATSSGVATSTRHEMDASTAAAALTMPSATCHQHSMRRRQSIIQACNFASPTHLLNLYFQCPHMWRRGDFVYVMCGVGVVFGQPRREPFVRCDVPGWWFQFQQVPHARRAQEWEGKERTGSSNAQGLVGGGGPAPPPPPHSVTHQHHPLPPPSSPHRFRASLTARSYCVTRPLRRSQAGKSRCGRHPPPAQGQPACTHTPPGP